MTVREIVHDGEGKRGRLSLNLCRIYHLQRSFIARSMSFELHSSISGHQSCPEAREGAFFASSTDLGFTRHDLTDVLRNFHKGYKIR